MLSSDYETKVTLNRRDFMDAIDRASILVRENDKKPLILNFTDEEMELKMHSAFGTMDARLAITKASTRSFWVMRCESSMMRK